MSPKCVPLDRIAKQMQPATHHLDLSLCSEALPKAFDQGQLIRRQRDARLGIGFHTYSIPRGTFGSSQYADDRGPPSIAMRDRGPPAAGIVDRLRRGLWKRLRRDFVPGLSILGPSRGRQSTGLIHLYVESWSGWSEMNRMTSLSLKASPRIIWLRRTL